MHIMIFQLPKRDLSKYFKNKLDPKTVISGIWNMEYGIWNMESGVGNKKLDFERKFRANNYLFMLFICS